MKILSYTLVADGPSDRCLLHLINWALAKMTPPSDGTIFINGQFADYRESPTEPRSLTERIECAIRDYPCDILFVHRDAEGERLERRREEISRATQSLKLPCMVCIIPIRMTEAWLLFDEPAIRRASGNPHGTAALRLPPLRRLEQESDPKKTLQTALESASEANGRRLRQFQRDSRNLVQRVAELIEDFSPLQSLPAFKTFYDELHANLAAHFPLRNPNS